MLNDKKDGTKEPSPRVPGMFRGKIIMDEDEFNSMDEEIAKSFYGDGDIEPCS